jgi:hypothetical protein
MDDDPGSRFVAGELARAIEFGRGALNPSCITDIELIANRFDSSRLDLAAGIEADDDTDDTGDNHDE